MDLPRPSSMDPWFIDLMMAGLLLFSGWTVRRGLANLDDTLKGIKADLSKFNDFFHARIEDHERRLTRMETLCDARYEGNE